MNNKKQVLENTINCIKEICQKIIEKKNYTQDMQNCVNAINASITLVLMNKNIEEAKVVSVLEDMMYGMSQKDDVFLLDVLRFGLLPMLEETSQKIEN